MKKTLVSLGLAAALAIPAGAAYAQTDDVVEDDDTVTCQMVEGAEIGNGYGAQQRRAQLGDEAPYGEPGDCVLNGDGPIQAQEHKQLRTADQTGIDAEGQMNGSQNQHRLGEEGPLGNPEDCTFDGDGPADGSGRRFGKS